MRQSKINNILFAQSIHPLKETRIIESPLILGFDSEYTSRSPHKLLFFQLWNKFSGPRIFRGGLSWDSLRGAVESLSGKLKRTAYLGCFWSTAELQHLDCTNKNVFFKEWRAGAYDATYKINTRVSLRIVDVAQWFSHKSLKDAAATFGLEKFNYDTSKITLKHKNNGEFLVYALNDAVVCGRLLERLRELIVEKFGVDILVYRTPASASMASFRKKYVKDVFSNPNMRVRRLALLASHGGANQAYYRGELRGDFVLYDAPSQFPQAVTALEKLPNAKDWTPARSVEDAVGAIDGVADAEFSFPPGFRYPSLPIDKGFLYFPLSGRSHCTLSELRAAIAAGADVTVKKLFVYYDGSNILARYMRDLIKKKDAAERAGQADLRYLYKLMAVSIIGKFTQKTERIQINAIVKRARELGMTTGEYTSILGKKEYDAAHGFIKRDVSLGSGYYPEWYTLILGKSRASIFEAARLTDALVISTDSFIFRMPPVLSTVWPLIFGGIAYEKRGSGDRFVCYREKLYALKSGNEFVHVAHHGNYAGEETTAALSGFRSGSISYTGKRIVTVREALSGGVRIGTDKRIKSTHSLDYSGRGTVQDNGFILPLER